MSSPYESQMDNLQRLLPNIPHLLLLGLIRQTGKGRAVRLHLAIDNRSLILSDTQTPGVTDVISTASK